MCIAAKITQKTPTNGEEFLRISALAMRMHCSHAPAQLRLARTHDRIEIEIDFPVRGGCHKGELTPPNLRYNLKYSRTLCGDSD